MKFENTTTMTNKELLNIVKKAIIAKKVHAHTFYSDEFSMSVHDGIHFTRVYTCVVVYIDGHRVQFNHYRLHEPCRGRCIHEIDPPFGGEEGGILIKARDGFGITVDY